MRAFLVFVFGLLLVAEVQGGPFGRLFKRNQPQVNRPAEKVEPKKEEPKVDPKKEEPKKTEPKPKLEGRPKTEVASQAIRKVPAPNFRD
jgi:hypothetical protein